MANFERDLEMDPLISKQDTIFDDTYPQYDETTFANEIEIPTWAEDSMPSGLTEDTVASKEAINRRIKEFQNAHNARFPEDLKLQFQGDKNGGLYVRWGRDWVPLTYKNNPAKFRAASTLRTNMGVDFARALGLEPELPIAVKVAARNLDQLTTEINPENIELERLGGVADRVSESVENLATQMHDAEVGTDLQLQQNVRDLERAHKFLNTLSGQINTSAAKISALEEGIVELKIEKESEGITPEEIIEIDKRIKELTEQRDLQKEHLNRDLLPGLKSQFARIRKTVNTVLYSDRTLGERIRTLFREQGVTIVSVITALGLAISTLAEAIALGVKSATPNPKPKPPGPKPGPKPGPDPGPDPGPKPGPTPGTREWIKQMLQKVANLLIELGDKALAALPGIIGAVVNFLLKSAASAVGFLAENLWALILAVGGLLYVYIIKLA